MKGYTSEKTVPSVLLLPHFRLTKERKKTRSFKCRTISIQVSLPRGINLPLIFASDYQIVVFAVVVVLRPR